MFHVAEKETQAVVREFQVRAWRLDEVAVSCALFAYRLCSGKDDIQVYRRPTWHRNRTSPPQP
jgi:hypothetical protein